MMFTGNTGSEPALLRNINRNNSNKKSSSHFYNLFEIYSYFFQMPFIITADHIDHKYRIKTSLPRKV